MTWGCYGPSAWLESELAKDRKKAKKKKAKKAATNVRN